MTWVSESSTTAWCWCETRVPGLWPIPFSWTLKSQQMQDELVRRCAAAARAAGKAVVVVLNVGSPKARNGYGRMGLWWIVRAIMPILYKTCHVGEWNFGGDLGYTILGSLRRERWIYSVCWVKTLMWKDIKESCVFKATVGSRNGVLQNLLAFGMRRVMGRKPTMIQWTNGCVV